MDYFDTQDPFSFCTEASCNAMLACDPSDQPMPTNTNRAALYLDTTGTISPSTYMSPQCISAPGRVDLLTPTWQPGVMAKLNDDPYAAPWNPISGRANESMDALGTTSQSFPNDYSSIALSGYNNQPRYTMPDSGYDTTSMVKTSPAMTLDSMTDVITTQPIPDMSTRSGARIKRRKTSSVTGRHSTARTSLQRDQAAEDLTWCRFCMQEGKYRRLKNPAELKKHELTHTRPHVCAHCIMPGFATRNDLERHQRNVHFIKPIHGTHDYYKCQLSNCCKKDKIFTRKDNFKAHIQRTHKNVTGKAIDSWVERSVYTPNQSEMRALMQAKKSGSKSQYSDMASRMGSDVQMSDAFASAHLDIHSDQGSIPGGMGQDFGANATPKIEYDGTQSFDMINDTRYMGGMGLMGSSSVSPITPTLSQSYPSQSTYPSFYRMPNIPPEPSYQNSMSDHGLGIDMEMAPFDSTTYNNFSMSFDAPTISSQPDEKPAKNALQKEVHSNGNYQCPQCPKSKNRLCDLNKHMKRHTKPFGCTYPKCTKRFGSKNDWKRHESSQHIQTELWRCGLGTCALLQPARIFYAREFVHEHLVRDHGVGTRDGEDEAVKEEVEAVADSVRIGGHASEGFWCGFCRVIVRPVDGELGDEGGDERVRHVGEHFDRDKDTAEWVCLEMNREKRYLWENV